MVEFILELLDAGLGGQSGSTFVQGRHLVDDGQGQEMRVLGDQGQDLLQHEAVLLRVHAADLRHDEVQSLLSFLLKLISYALSSIPVNGQELWPRNLADQEATK